MVSNTPNPSHLGGAGPAILGRIAVGAGRAVPVPAVLRLRLSCQLSLPCRLQIAEDLRPGGSAKHGRSASGERRRACCRLEQSPELRPLPVLGDLFIDVIRLWLVRLPVDHGVDGAVASRRRFRGRSGCRSRLGGNRVEDPLQTSLG